MRKYKVIDLFGNEEERIITGAVAKNASKKSLFTDYEGFVDKFKPKKTTDDCYTPAEVYGAVLNYVKKYTDLSDKEILRPFYPGGDYEAIDYKANTVVIDNPPFSILSNGCKHEQVGNATNPQHKTKLSAHLLMFVVIGRLELKLCGR